MKISTSYLVRMNPNFIRRYSGGEEWLQYKGRSPLYVINYKRTEATEIDQTRSPDTSPGGYQDYLYQRGIIGKMSLC